MMRWELPPCSRFREAQAATSRAAAVNEFEAHEAKEEKSLEQYKKLAREMPSPATRFILHLIISDEEKHHAVFHAMLATLKSSLLWTQPE